jgi:hypothetical protein
MGKWALVGSLNIALADLLPDIGTLALARDGAKCQANRAVFIGKYVIVNRQRLPAKSRHHFRVQLMVRGRLNHTAIAHTNLDPVFTGCQRITRQNDVLLKAVLAALFTHT